MEYTLEEIGKRADGTVKGDGSIRIRGVAKIEEAVPGDITFVANPKYIRYIEETKASAVVVAEGMEITAAKNYLVSPNPYFTFLKIIRIFHPEVPPLEPGIHATAVIGEGTELGKDVAVGPHVVIGKGCRIGAGSILMPGVFIGDRTRIGENCLVRAGVKIREDVTVGNRVILHEGVVLGSDGFGFAPEGEVYHKIPQVGTVVIEDDVEIGANSTVDRATMGETRIKKGAKLDNLIQVGHNCIIGENTVIAAQAGLSGSTHLGKNVRVGGQAGFAGHMTVGDQAAIGAQSGVHKSVPPGVMVLGYPAKPHIETARIEAASRRLPDLIKDLREIKERLEKLEKKRRKNA